MAAILSQPFCVNFIAQLVNGSENNTPAETGHIM